MRRFEKVKNLIACVTITAAMLLGGCASENAVDTSGKADNSIISASVSEISDEVNGDASNESEVTGSVIEKQTEDGIALYENIVEKAVCAYAAELYTDFEMAQLILGDSPVQAVRIDIDNQYNEQYDSGMIVLEDENLDYVQCAILEVIFLMNEKQEPILQ